MTKKTWDRIYSKIYVLKQHAMNINRPSMHFDIIHAFLPY